MTMLPTDAPDQLVEFYTLYGLAFLTLFVAVFLQPRVDRSLPFASDAWLLGAFALLQGLREFLEGWAILYPHAAADVVWVDAGLVAAAFLALFEFGRRLSLGQGPAVGDVTRKRWIGVWIYALLAAAILTFSLVADRFVFGFTAGVRLFLGLPGAVAGGWVLLAHSEDRDWAVSPRSGSALRAGGIALMIYGVATGLVIPEDPGLPAWLPSPREFHRFVGFPVQALQMACAFVLAPALIFVTREATIAARRREAAAIEEAVSLNASLVERIKASTAELESVNRSLLAEIQERKKVEEVLRESEKLLDTIANSSPALIRLSDRDRASTDFNQGWLRFTGMTAERAAGSGWLDALHPEDLGRYRLVQERAYSSREPFEIEYRLRRHDGVYRWMLEQGRPRFAAGGEFAGFIGSSLDITDRKQTEARLLEAMEQLQRSELRQRELTISAQRDQGRLRSLLAAMRIGILLEDRDRRVDYVNPAFIELWGIDADFPLVGDRTDEILAHSKRQLAQPSLVKDLILSIPQPGEGSERVEIAFQDGQILTQTSHVVTDVGDQLIGRLWLYEDITHERQTAEQLRYLAERDPLTGLYNRHRFDDHLQTMLAISSRSGRQFALISFDLDEFKFVNDTFGHKAGDTVLVRIAGEIGSLIRAGDVFARLGGDEFAVLTALAPGDDPTALPHRILNAINGIAFRFADTNIRMSGSIGIAIYPEHGTDAEDLVAHADTAMYQAKAMGRNTLAMFDPRSDLVEAMAERLSWSRRIGEALKNDGLVLHFQGVYELVSNQLHHLEALVRMRDPANPGVLINPGRFMAAAEQSGQIGQIDRWVLGTVIEFMARNPQLPPIAVNLSSRTLIDPGLPRFIRAKLAEEGVVPAQLIVEIGEVAAVADITQAQRFIDAMREVGCRVCLENFGSGLSSFTHLRVLGAEILKIDGSFIRDLPENPANQVLIKAMAAATGGLGKILVAEFVEDATTLEIVRGLGVPLAQGYHLDRPTERGADGQPTPAG